MMRVMSIPDPARISQALLAWYDVSRRDLPWRGTTDPYAVWVSEVMLQQTQVGRVIDYWTRFLDALPTVESLAGASLDDVLALWSGLGYYSRARRLHAAAREVVDERGGRLPETAAGLRELPGMGDYTSAAVASIAFGEPVPVLDANVVRVLSRLLASTGDPRRAGVRRELRAAAAEIVRVGRPGDVNQALMELGALVCLPREPACDDCPLFSFCAGRQSGDPRTYPAAAGRPEVLTLREAALVLCGEGTVLLTRERHPRGWWNDLWRLPTKELGSGRPEEPVWESVVKDELPDPPGKAGSIRYSVTRHRVVLDVYVAELDAVVLPGRGFRWVLLETVQDLAFPAPHMRALGLAGVA
ncbi:MAG: A/G-specific adenine glycosylase [Candidatus Eisenbacteria bacterium]|nr:A/G-specific adenine glycosylase [Candidatus Eisenbacteria bacterium]